MEHNSHDTYYRSVVGAAEAGSKVRLAVTLRTKERINQVLVRFWRDREGETLENLRTDSAPGSEEFYYYIDVTMPDKGCLLWYYFIISTESGTRYFGNNSERMGGSGDLYTEVPPSFQITVYNKGAKTPDWFKHSVMYQIFPDRFYRAGNTLVEKKGAVFHASWQDDPCYYKDPDTKEIVAYDFFGGNLKGIEEKLSYLKKLGISVIYLNPVFESESNHHYDTGDYHKIDPILGTNEDFHHLIETAKSMGIRIIIDGVFSHTGSNSRYFNRAGQYDTVGAFQSQDSPYYKWYNFRNFPYEYDSWWGFSTLPNVTETTPSYMDFIIRDKDSVLHHWVKEGIGGWRLDVIDELPAEFSQSFYKELKATNPDAVMIGEVWEDASNKISYGTPREYLCGQEMDSAMNYPFRQHMFDFLLGNIDGGECMKRMESLRENYPKENFYAMMNLIGSHDIMRAVTVLGEATYYDGMPAIDQSRYRMDKEKLRIGRARLLMAALWQMTYPGVPCVYYGDEIAMQGFKDPTNRRPYDWENGDKEIFTWYEKFIKARNDNDALQTGWLLPMKAEGDIFAYTRITRNSRDVFGAKAEDGAFVVVFNRNKEREVSVSLDVSDYANGVFVDVFDDKETYPIVGGRLNLKMPPLSGKLLELKELPRQYGRVAGVLLHPTSLPSKYGIGDLGREAYKFVDFLAESGQSVWQILPLCPVGYGYSPYQSPSAFAGNPMLIDLTTFVDRDLIPESEIVALSGGGSFVDFERVWSLKRKCLKKGANRFFKIAAKDEEYQNFIEKEASWLDDYALFMALKRYFKDEPWNKWPEKLVKRDKRALADYSRKLAEDIRFEKFLQFAFFNQWHRLREYANEKGIKILGDMPIFVSHDSVDVWANQKLFDLNPDGSPNTVAGVPPDYFSATGQLWGNPQYDWEAMKKENYRWWKHRMKKLYEMVDIIRIDHFRGFESYWEVDGRAKTAINGIWRKGPGKEFFDELKKELGDLPIVAEDLGIITNKVEELRDACGFPA